MNIELRNELYLSSPCSTGSWTIDSFYHFSIVTLLLANCYNNDSSRKKATDLHLTSCCMSSRVNLTSKNKAVNLVVLQTFATAYRNKNVDLFLNNLIVLVCNFCFSNSPYNKANIFLGLIEYELNSLLGALHLVDYISIHIRFDLERYLLNGSPPKISLNQNIMFATD